MRAIALCLCCGLLLGGSARADGTDRMPREGSGWAGFDVGTWVRLKRTMLIPGRTPAVTIWRTELTKAEKTALTLETSAKNALDMENRTSTTVSREGEAAPGETEKVEALEDEAVVVGDRTLACARTRTTLTGPSGRRVITKWIAKDPELLAKRTEVRYDAAGRAGYRSAWLALGWDVPHEVGGRTVACVKYRVRTEEGKVEISGEVLASRDVPGGLVFEESDVRTPDGTQSYRVVALGFGTK